MKAVTMFSIWTISSSLLIGCSTSSKNIDVCRCLTEPGNSSFMKENEKNCRDEISKELGVDNWEKINMSQNSVISSKFDALARRCQ